MKRRIWLAAAALCLALAGACDSGGDDSGGSSGTADTTGTGGQCGTMPEHNVDHGGTMHGSGGNCSCCHDQSKSPCTACHQ